MTVHTTASRAKPGSTVHKTATRIHNRIKAAHPDTSITHEDIVDDICDEFLDDIKNNVN